MFMLAVCTVLALSPLAHAADAAITPAAAAAAAASLTQGITLSQNNKPAEAAAAFRAALVSDPTLRQAHLGLAQLAATAADWKQAVSELALGIEVTSATAGELIFYAQCAVQVGDCRLAATLASLGITRFPNEPAFRRIELSGLIRSGRAEEARSAILALLEQTPADADLWRNLAWSAANNPTTNDDDLLAALELASLAKPDDAGLSRQLADAQLARHLPRQAWERYRQLAATSTDPLLLTSAARAADAAGEWALGRELLTRIPAAQRTRDQRLLAARLSVQAHDPAAARAALGELISLGDNDPQLLTWAGALAEEQGDSAQAVALYQQALTQADYTPATLRLIASYLRSERRDEAATLLNTHLARHPDDAQAQALLAYVRPSPTGKAAPAKP